MKRVRREETIGNNRQCEESDKKDPFSILPMDLRVEILLRIPAKSRARMVLVSKQWLSMLCGKDLTNLYLARSSTRKRLLFAVCRTYVHEMFLQSISQKDPSNSEDHHKVNIPRHPRRLYAFSPPVRGLICRQNDSIVMIGNPSTGQFITLPRVKTRRRGLLSFFGYDPVNDVYKVLCMTVLQVRQQRGSQVVSEEHQVFTLGAKQKWRMIGCKHPHLPPCLTKGICINGVVYYYAWIKNEGSLVSFDLISEEFNVIKLPEDFRFLVNYNGKIALVSRCTVTLDMWVLEDASKQEWSKVSLSLTSLMDLGGDHQGLYFRGALSTGELIFSPYSFTTSFYFISYDLKSHHAKKVVVEEIGDHLSEIQVYVDHIESPMFLPNLS